MAWWLSLLIAAVSAQIEEDPMESTRIEYIKEISSGFYEIEPFKKSDGELGFRAVYPLEKDFNLMAVELEMSVTSFDVYEWTPFLTRCSDECKVAARLIYLRFADKAKNFFTNYVKGLSHDPKSMSAWSDSELDFLEQFNLFHETISEATFATDSFNQFSALAAGKIPSTFVDYNKWKWAFAHVTRGTIGLPIKIWKNAKGYKAKDEDEGRIGLAFYPMIETVKHCAVRNSHRTSIRMGIEQKPVLVSLTSDRRFRTGEELCFDQGDLNNLRLVYQEGRVVFPNPFDYYVHTIDNDKPQYCEELLGIDTCSFQLTLTVSAKMLWYVRAYTAEATSVELVEDYFSHYAGLPDEQESKESFFKSAVLYSLELKRNVMQPILTKSLREMRRELKAEEIPRKKVGIELGIVSSLMLYKHLEAADRLLMGLLAMDLEL
jgi:hypothetical protein